MRVNLFLAAIKKETAVLKSLSIATFSAKSVIKNLASTSSQMLKKTLLLLGFMNLVRIEIRAEKIIL